MYTSALRDASGSFAQVAQAMLLVPHAFVEDGHTQPSFVRAQRLLASAAGVPAGLSADEQADEVALFLLQRASTDDTNPESVPFVQHAAIFAEIGRLKNVSVYERFLPCFDACHTDCGFS